MDKGNEIQVQELSPARLDDYLSYFDHDAFADNPRWASCYCHFYFANHETKPWGERDAQENRSAVIHLIQAGKMHGYLAYLDGKPVGWCNATARALLPNLPSEQGNAEEIGSIVCFVIAKPFHGQGVARQLLEAACNGFKQQGFKLVEAYPIESAESQAANYHGPLSLYLSAGFEIHHHDPDSRVVVRKAL